MTTPITRGVLWALLAAVLFGVTTPLIQRAGDGLGVFATAGLLYVGAAAGTLRWAAVKDREPPLGRDGRLRLVLIAIVGAAIGPALLVYALKTTSALTTSLLLNIEAPLTLLGARWLHREHVGARVWLAAALMLVAGGFLVLDASASGRAGTWLGVLAAVGAVAAWALDNNLTRPLADRDPVSVIRGKAAIGAGITLSLAVLRAEPMPGHWAILTLVALGATGYGASLRAYLEAQRRIGAGRTGSLFATAPFLGAVVAFGLGDRGVGPLSGLAALLFVAAVVLHLREEHDHEHCHEALEHEHAHHHHEGHHDHVHETYPEGAHSHPHRHTPLLHRHPHGEDLHHGHH